ncbi:MAG: iron ABC transporter permease [Aquincola sp.]|nr:iron ABC transporter permease [Aquincola sp.]MDH4290138.1 iron ABC transporter permease [Aquincola sp.]MDH5329327.1 iron ABC transporter permease [Aquincola sp.]
MTAAALRTTSQAPAPRDTPSVALAAGALALVGWAAPAPVALAATTLALIAAWLERPALSALGAAAALAWLLGSGFAAGTAGSAFGWPVYAALLALTVLFARALARRGLFVGDPIVAAIVITIAALLALFIFFPVGKSLLAAVLDNEGAFAPALAIERLLSPDIWGLGCFGGRIHCGVAINSVMLATIVGLGTTLLGLVMALAAQRGAQRFSGLYSVMAVLPIVTPPFVIALALVVLFGRTGLITGWLSVVFDVPRTRWIYGLTGVTLAQMLTFTPIAFMILHGALAAVSPSLEEAAQTLRASRARVFRTVTWPLLRPALANAFLLGFVESLADFGNPVVLAGNYEVLSTKIFFAVAGAQHEPGRAAALATVLLGFTLIAFWLQQRWLGRASYVTVSGKGDAGLPAQLPASLRRGCIGVAMGWIVFTLACYAVIAVGGFVKDIGRGDMTPVMAHFSAGFAVEWRDGAPAFVGSAWDSFFTTVEVAAIAAPLTAVIGLLSAYVITRQRFAGRRTFEFLTMVSFAVPGTVIGVAYIVAFNVPPVELTGGLAILVLCFVFRNMPVGVRAGIAALAQIDKSLDEASSTLRASTLRTLRRVVMPLLKPAIVATLVFSFTHAMTAVSAVIFLATAKYNLATVYIIGRVEAGEYPLAIAYSTVLIVFMLTVLLLVQWLTGSVKLGRRSQADIVTGH